MYRVALRGDVRVLSVAVTDCSGSDHARNVARSAIEAPSVVHADCMPQRDLSGAIPPRREHIVVAEDLSADALMHGSKTVCAFTPKPAKFMLSI